MQLCHPSARLRALEFALNLCGQHLNVSIDFGSLAVEVGLCVATLALDRGGGRVLLLPQPCLWAAVSSAPTGGPGVNGTSRSAISSRSRALIRASILLRSSAY